MTEEVVRALSFGEAAQEYDRVRPGYPSELVDDVLAYAGPRHAGGAVDVGAGTGRVTLAFAGRGVAVTAVEPDPRMAEVLAASAAGLPVTVHVGQFETFPVVDPFDLLTCGQAWHWVDPATRWDRAADAVRPGGTVALFGNGDHPADLAVIEHMRVAYAAHAPELWNDAPLRWMSQPRPQESTMHWDEMAGQPRLVDYTTRLYRWQRTLSAADFVTLLSTTSAHRILDEAVRSDLHADLLSRLTGDIVFNIDTELHLARRR